MMEDETKSRNLSEEKENKKLEQLLETEKLIEKHEQLKKTLKKRLRTIAEKSRNLVFEQVDKDKYNQKMKSIGKGVAAGGSGISFLGATLIPFVPPAGFGVSAFGAGVSVVGYLILGVNTYFRIKAKKGKEKLARQEFEAFYAEMNLIIDEYDESSTAILEDLSTYPEIAACQSFEEQLDIIQALVEKYNKRIDGKHLLVELHSHVTTLMRKDRELNEDENTRIDMEKLIEATKEAMKEAVNELVAKQKVLEAEVQDSKEETDSKKFLPKMAKPVLGTAYATALPSLYLPGEAANNVYSVGMASHAVYFNASAAATCTNAAQETALFGLEFGSVIFGIIGSFIAMCANGHGSRRAFKNYKALKDLQEKADLAGDDKEQLRVLMEHDKYKELAGKAINTIEVTEKMTDILDGAI